MRVLLVSGIFPPDIGGPATHAAEIRAALRTRGHEVETVSLTDEPRADHEDGVHRFPRAEHWPTRNARVVAFIARRARGCDVIYATGLAPAAVAAGRLARRPVIVKIVADAAWERGSRLGLTSDSFDRFQDSASGGLRLRAMRALRNWSVRHATEVVAPSEHLARSIRRWVPGSSVVVIPNGARAPAPADASERPSRARLDLLFVGRLVSVKRVDLLIRAVAQLEIASLAVVGDGPELDGLRSLVARLGADDRISFTGVLDHEHVLRRIATADALVLASTHEGLPHVVLEALVSGTPVVTTPAGGVAEVLSDEIDGLVVRDETADGFAAAFERLAGDPMLLARLRAGAAVSGDEWRFSRCADRLEALMRATARHPRAVVVARARMTIPPRADDERKYELHARHLRTVIVCPATRPGIAKPGGATVVGLPPLRTPLLGTMLFYSVAPVVALGLAAGRRQTAIVCQSPYEGFGVLVLRQVLPLTLRPPVQIELHGDWRTATRLYGSSRRRVVSGAADRVAVWALRRADRVRPVSDVLGNLARDAGYCGPIDRFIAFSDYGAFLDHRVEPLPDGPHALFVGALERSKAPDVLLDAWPEVLRSVPDAQLTVVGAGSLERALRDRLVDGELKESVRMLAPMPRSDLRRLIDGSSCLVVPSRSEGLGRIALETMARGRGVVASRVGGLVELVADGRNGRLVAPEDPHALAEALSAVLSDRTLAQAMGTESRRRAVARDPLHEYEAGIERMADWIAG